MADKVQADWTSGRNLYMEVRNSSGQAYRADTQVFENYVTANLTATKYAIAMTQQGTASGYYTATFPAVAGGLYSVRVRERIGGSPAETDTTVAAGDVQWNGTTFVTEAVLNQVDFGGVADEVADTLTFTQRLAGDYTTELADSLGELTSDVIAAAIVDALTAAGVLDESSIPGESVVEQFIGEDRNFGVVLAGDLTGAEFSFAIAKTLAEALAGGGVVVKTNADIDVSGQTVTVDLITDGDSADLDKGEYFQALRRTDTGNRRVEAWGPRVVVG